MRPSFVLALAAVGAIALAPARSAARDVRAVTVTRTAAARTHKPRKPSRPKPTPTPPRAAEAIEAAETTPTPTPAPEAIAPEVAPTRALEPDPEPIVAAVVSSPPRGEPEAPPMPPPAIAPEISYAPSLPPPSESHVWIGARYRLSMVPAPVMRALADAQTSLLVHSVSADLEIRAGRFVVTPSVSFSRLASDTILVGDGRGRTAPHMSAARFDLRAVTPAIDVAWRAPLSSRVELEIGASIGVSFVGGALWTGWVHESDAGSLAAGNRHYAQCLTVYDGIGCRPQDHASPTPVRVGWFGSDPWVHGADVPPVLPWLSLPQIGVRARVASDLALRVATGVSVTGIWVSAGVAWGPFKSR